VTIAFGIIVEHGLIEWDALTLGFGGISNIPKPRFGSHALGLGGYFYVVLAAAVASLVLARNLQRSRWGRALVAVRESDVAAESIGLNPYWVRTVAFTLGAAFAGAGGCLLASWQRSVFPDNFLFTESVNILAMVILGGMGSLPGVILGAAIIVALPEVFREFQLYRLLAFGLLLIVLMIFRPNGLLAFEGRREEEPEASLDSPCQATPRERHRWRWRRD
jgi:branched-chain amino acid transport system permease protein